MVLGIVLVLVAQRLQIPSIVTLLLGGIATGPYGLGLIDPQALGSEGLKTIVAFAIGLILFEAGLTLNVRDYKKISRKVKALLTYGILITWFLIGAIIHYFFPAFSWNFSLLAASLVIITGPTVIGPLLKRVHVKKKLFHILHWEGVLIDPLGVFVTLLCYEWLISGGQNALVHFIERFAIGISFGLIWGFLISAMLRKSLVPYEKLNSFVLAAAIAIFTTSNYFAHESGLLSVIMAGFIIGVRDNGQLQQVKIYKEQLIEILIGLLFILLAANLNIYSFGNYGWELLIVVALIIFAVRPINVFLSTWGLDLTIQDKTFLSWMAPRGIVSASMASLFALNLKDTVGVHQAQFLETFAYSIIFTTVIIQGSSAHMVAKLLGVLEPKPNGWLVVGSHKLGRKIALFIQKQDAPVVIMDNNLQATTTATSEKLTAICDDALTVHPEEYTELYDVGNVLAITPNKALNTLVCKHWKRELHSVNTYKWFDAQIDTNKKDMFVGQVVWQQLPLQQIFKEESEVKVIEKTMQVENIRHPERVLVCSYRGQVLPFIPKDATGECCVLKYTPITPDIELNIKESWMILESFSSIAQALAKLLENLKKEFSKLPTEELTTYLEHEEQEYTSLIGQNIVVFQAYTDHIENSVVAIAKLKEPIAMLSNDIHIVFLVLSPKGEPQKHLNTLSQISRFILQEENRKQLLASKTKEELFDVFF